MSSNYQRNHKTYLEHLREQAEEERLHDLRLDKLQKENDRLISELKTALVACYPIESDDMSPSSFERYVGVVFKIAGFEIKHIGGSGDMGVDLIASKGDIRKAIQVKRYDRDSNTVGVKAFQEVHAGKEMHDCDEAAVITTSSFTNAAKEMAKKLRIEALDGNDFKKYVEDVFVTRK